MVEKDTFFRHPSSFHPYHVLFVKPCGRSFKLFVLGTSSYAKAKKRGAQCQQSVFVIFIAFLFSCHSFITYTLSSPLSSHSTWQRISIHPPLSHFHRITTRFHSHSDKKENRITPAFPRLQPFLYTLTLFNYDNNTHSLAWLLDANKKLRNLLWLKVFFRAEIPFTVPWPTCIFFMNTQESTVDKRWIMGDPSIQRGSIVSHLTTSRRSPLQSSFVSYSRS